MNLNFIDALNVLFKEDETQQTVQFLNILDVPLPHAHEEYINGTDGFLVFDNKTATVIRIEEAQRRPNSYITDQIINPRPNHPLLLEPLGSFYYKNLVIEVCPGLKIGGNPTEVDQLVEQLARDGLNFYDPHDHNIGTLNLPDRSIKIVIDRPAVAQFTRNVTDSMSLLMKYQNPQGIFNPLRKAFRRAMVQPETEMQKKLMQDFNRLCMTYKENGLLVCDWNNEKSERNSLGIIDYKTRQARLAAGALDKKR